MRRLDNIDIRLLRVFIVLADEGGFADAQIALNLSQSTLSTHLAELEKRIGAQLCQRGRQQFRLTEIGKATYEAAHKLFRDLDDFNQRISAANGSLSGRLKVGTSDGVSTDGVLGVQRVISHFLKPGADVFVDLALGTPSELERGVADGDLDVAIGPMSQKAPGVEYRDHALEPHSLYCGSSHSLFERPDRELDKREIEAAPFSVRKYRHFDDLYIVGHPRASAAVADMEAQLMLILSGRFIGFLPCHYARGWVENGELRALKPDSYGFNSIHRIAFRTKEADKPLISAFVTAANEVRLLYQTPAQAGEFARRM